MSHRARPANRLTKDGRTKRPVRLTSHCLRPDGVRPRPPLGAWRREPLMYDLAAIAIALACFAFVFVLLWVLERV